MNSIRTICCLILALPSLTASAIEFQNFTGSYSVLEQAFALTTEETKIDLAGDKDKNAQIVLGLISRISLFGPGKDLLQYRYGNDRVLLKLKSVNKSSSGMSFRFKQFMLVSRAVSAQPVPIEGAEIVVTFDANGKMSHVNSGLVLMDSVQKEVRGLNFSRANEKTRLALLNILSPFEETLQARIKESKLDHAAQSALNILQTLKNNKGAVLKTTLGRILLNSAKEGTLSFIVRERNGQRYFVVRLVTPFGLDLIVESENNEQGELEIRDLGKFSIGMTEVGLFRPKNFILGLVPGLNEHPKPLVQSNQISAFESSNQSVEVKQIGINLLGVLDFYRSKYARESYDGQGSLVKALVNVTHSLLRENAAWAGGPYKKFYFGAGTENLSNFGFARDVIGHEFFHAVDESSANLLSENQAGGLKEHAADIMGIVFKLRTNGHTIQDLEQELMIGDTVLSDAAKQIFASRLGRNVKALRHLTLPEHGLQKHFANVAAAELKYPQNCIPTVENDKCGAHDLAGVPNLAMGRAVVELAKSQLLSPEASLDLTADIVFEAFVNHLRPQQNYTSYANTIVSVCAAKVAKLKNAKEICQVYKDNFAQVGIQAVATDTNANTSSQTLQDAQKEICQMYKDLNAKGIKIELPSYCQ